MKVERTMGQVIRLVREQKGISRERLSLLCKRHGTPVHPNTIYRLEQSKVDSKVTSMGAVCRALGIELEARPRRVSR